MSRQFDYASELSYIGNDRASPWQVYLEQIDRVLPHLGTLADEGDTLRRPKRALIVDVPSDFLVPAAIENQITRTRAQRLSAKIVIEGANAPTTPDADDVLRERDITVVPDVIANAGGVIVSYFEWVQDFSSFFWSEDEINRRLEQILVGAYGRIWDVAEQRGIPLRTAAFIVACERILNARRTRGLYP